MKQNINLEIGHLRLSFVLSFNESFFPSFSSLILATAALFPNKMPRKHRIASEAPQDLQPIKVNRWSQSLKLFALLVIPLIGIFSTTSMKLLQATETNNIAQKSRTSILRKEVIAFFDLRRKAIKQNLL